MSSTGGGQDERADQGERLSAWAGLIGSALFVTVVGFQDLLRSGYDWVTTPASAHSLDPHGWIQIANFVVAGTCVLLFAWGAAGAFPEGETSRLGPRLLGILGACILGSGPLVMDPPPTVMFSPRSTWHGNLHGVLGAIGFTLMPLSCFVFYRRFRKVPSWRWLARWSLAAGILIVLAIVLLKLAQLRLLPDVTGLLQRIVLIAFFGWVFAFALRVLRTLRSSGATPRHV